MSAFGSREVIILRVIPTTRAEPTGIRIRDAAATSGVGTGGAVRGAGALRGFARRLLMVGAGLVFGLFGAPTFASVTISGQFTPLAILQGDRTRMRINFQSNDTVNPVLLANFFNLLPAPLVLYAVTSPGYVAPQGDCNSTTEAGQTIVTSPAFITTTGNNRVDLVNGTVPIAPSAGSGSCFIEVDVTVPSGPTTSYTNTLVRANFSSTPATMVDGATNPQFSLNVTALAPLTATKTFGTNPLAQGNTTAATIVITNPVANGTAAIPLTTFSDTLPANLTVVGTPTATCTSGINPTVTSAANTSPITTSGGTIAGNSGTCTITATVRGILTAPATSAAGTNTLPANAFGNIRGLPLAAAVNTPITVNSPIRLSKTFSPNPLSLGQAASATITIFNDSSALLTGVTLDDDTATGRWPPQIDNSGAPVIGGTSVGCTAPDLIAGAGSRGFRLGSTIPATIGAGGRCVISVPITSNTASVGAADWTNTIPLNAVGNNEGFTAPAVSARLDVRSTLPNVTKTVNRVTVAPGDLVTYVVSITTFNPVAQTGVTFTDTLPSNNGGLQAILAAAPGATLPVLAGAGCNP